MKKFIFILYFLSLLSLLSCFTVCGNPSSSKTNEKEQIKNMKQKIDALSQIGELYFLKKDYKKSFKTFENAEKLLDKNISKLPQQYVVENLINIANGYYTLGKDTKAKKNLYKALKIINESNSIPKRSRINLYYSLAVSFHELKKYSEALKYYNLTIKTHNKFYKEPFLDKQNIYLAIGMCLQKLKKYSEAYEYVKNSIAIASDDLTKAKCLYVLATILDKQKKYDRAIGCYDESLHILLNLSNINPLHIASNYRCKAEALKAADKTSQAIISMRKALKYTQNKKVKIIINKQIEKWEQDISTLLKKHQTSDIPLESDNKKYEALVEQIRAMNLSPSKEINYRLDDLNDFSSLREVKEKDFFRRGQGAGCVWIRITEDKKLTVVIETVDNSHAGEEGFVYTDKPLRTSDFGNGWLKAEVPGSLFLTSLDRKINDNWWIVIYNLD